MRVKNAEIAIRLTKVGKKYTIHHEKPTLVEKLTRKQNETFWAMKDLNLIVKKGERVGIMGPNGGGKTLLLKIIAGITTPTVGRVETNGKVVSLIDLRAGFHPDLNGVQNIFLNGLLLGLTKNTINDLLPSIIKFADIGRFIDVPLYTYSEGMALRLGFSVAIHSDPDILILDEGLNVGDSDFHEKSQKKLSEFFQKGKTVLVVSHWVDYIARNCSRVIFMQDGRIKQDKDAKILSSHRKPFVSYQNNNYLKKWVV